MKTSKVLVLTLALMASIPAANFIVGCSGEKSSNPITSAVNPIDTTMNPNLADSAIDLEKIITSDPESMAGYVGHFDKVYVPTLEEFSIISDSIIGKRLIADSIAIREDIWQTLRSLAQSRKTSPVPIAASVYFSELTRQEFWLLMANPWNINATKTARSLAESAARNVWPGMSQYQDKADAFRHAYWNILMSKYVSISWAQQMATAHESESPNTVDKAMDLDNNAVGRRLFSQYSWYSESDFVYLLRYYTYVRVFSVTQYTWYLVYLM